MLVDFRLAHGRVNRLIVTEFRAGAAKFRVDSYTGRLGIFVLNTAHTKLEKHTEFRKHPWPNWRLPSQLFWSIAARRGHSTAINVKTVGCWIRLGGSNITVLDKWLSKNCWRPLPFVLQLHAYSMWGERAGVGGGGAHIWDISSSERISQKVLD